MPLFYRWSAPGIAILLALVALLAPLRGADEVTVDCGTFHITNASQYAQSTCTVTFDFYFGCVGAGTFGYGGWNGYNNFQWYVPAASTGGLRKESRQFNVVAIFNPPAGGWTAGSHDAQDSASFSPCLVKGISPQLIVDAQPVTIKFKAVVIKESSGNQSALNTTTARAVISLKEGGTVTGATRLPVNGGVTQPTTPPDVLNVVTEVPQWATDDQGRVYNPDVPNYSIGGQSGSYGSGVQWMQVSVDHGSVTGIPQWMSSAFPGAVRFDSGGSTYLVGVLGRNFNGGGGTAFTGNNGTTGISAWGSGNFSQYDLQFPVMFHPRKVDGATPAPAQGDYSKVDPCFGPGLGDLGLSPTPPDDPNHANPPPGTVAGGTNAGPKKPDGSTGTGVKLPDSTPIGAINGGSGGVIAGGTKTTPGSGSPVTGNSGYIPGTGGSAGTGTDGNSGTYDYETPGNLPEDGKDTKDAQDMAKRHVDNVNDVQSSAGGLGSWAHMTPTTFGQAGEWVVSMPIAGSNYAMRIPTEHAPLVRALMLLVVQGVFIAAGFKVLLS